MLVEKFVGAVASVKVGDPTEADTFMGPLSSTAARDGLAAQVDDAVAKGTRVLTGGSPLDQPGAWFQPTVLTGVTPEMRAFSEELFGPVAVLYPVSSEDEAVELANNSVYGLGAVIQSTDPAKAQEIADRLDTGMVDINEAPGTAAELPFGGIKRSGGGRELGKYGMDEFVNRKLIRTGNQRTAATTGAGSRTAVLSGAPLLLPRKVRPPRLTQRSYDTESKLSLGPAPERPGSERFARASCK
ncbi:aldehyde dehydrogenase family protein [Pseudarthrobacter sp. S9]|uniref:aldehyde dehydrogenase family protein n=1 Tax=Pseudarthrobacter sp. S9 TaxID=3418421 RepID=UPI003D04B430